MLAKTGSYKLVADIQLIPSVKPLYHFNYSWSNKAPMSAKGIVKLCWLILFVQVYRILFIDFRNLFQI